MRLWLILVVLAACSVPPLSIKLAIKGGANLTCPSTACADVPMACPAMVFLRILDPNDPNHTTLVSQCREVQADNRQDLCSIANVSVGAVELPERTLEIQVVVLPLVPGSDGQPDCDAVVADLHFADGTGVPENTSSSPPIGGHAYYHPGDAETVVELGCNDLDVLNSCQVSTDIEVDATVDDFLTTLAVSTSVADQLTVSVGEPVPMAVGSGGVEYTLKADDIKGLDRTSASPVPEWSSTEVSAMFTLADCVNVLEDGPVETATLHCERAIPGATKLALTGIRLPNATLTKILSAITDPDFTLDKGVVIGIVVDNAGSAVPNLTVAASDPLAHVRYLTDGAMATLDGTATSSNGIFVSTDAGFDTTWSTQLNAANMATGFGGLVDAKVTIVVLQFKEPINN